MRRNPQLTFVNACTYLHEQDTRLALLWRYAIVFQLIDNGSAVARPGLPDCKLQARSRSILKLPQILRAAWKGCGLLVSGLLVFHPVASTARQLA